MRKAIDNMEQLINLILMMNGPRPKEAAPLSTSVSLATPLGKMMVYTMDYEFVAADPSIKKIPSKSAKNTTIQEVVSQTLGSFREPVRRILSVTNLSSGGLHTTKAANSTIWVLEGQRPAEDPDAPNQKWKVVASVGFELPGDHEREIELETA